jgi:hypothetical protein
MVWLPISSTTWFLFVVLVHLDCFDSFLADNILDSNACQTCSSELKRVQLYITLSVGMSKGKECDVYNIGWYRPEIL